MQKSSTTLVQENAPMETKKIFHTTSYTSVNSGHNCIQQLLNNKLQKCQKNLEYIKTSYLNK